MRFLDSPKDRAGLLILALGVAILLALVPFLSGLLGAAVLYVMFAGTYKRMARVMPDGLASALTLILAIVVIAAIITPSSDVASQLIVAGPMVILYVLSIAIAWVFGKKRTADA